MIDHLPAVLAHIQDRIDAIKDNKVTLSEDIARLDELRRILNICEALQCQGEIMSRALVKAGNDRFSVTSKSQDDPLDLGFPRL